MTYWIELHCDTPIAESPDAEMGAKAPYRTLACANMLSEYPSIRVQRFEGAAYLVAQQARKRGWQWITGRGWQCPHCLKHRKPRRKEVVADK